MPEPKQPVDGVGLALSGGGYRATLFHIGTLWRLNELGWLPKLTRITSVSGGSITAGILGLNWKKLQFDSSGIATNFHDEVFTPLHKMCSTAIDVKAGLSGIFSLKGCVNDKVNKAYKKHLFGKATLQDLPADNEGPRFVFYATNLQTGSNVRFSRPYLADYKLGAIENPTTRLSFVVSASSAFPPCLSPATLNTNPADWKKWEGAYLYDQQKLRKKLVLTDGGVYDNLGLESIWNTYKTVLVSDAGAPLSVEPDPQKDWVQQSIRVLDIITDQTRALRKRRLIDDFIHNVRQGAYWGLATHIDNYGLATAMIKDNARTAQQKTIRTRLDRFSDKEQSRLVNWGYALTDAAMRTHVLENDPGPGQWPFPNFSLDQ